MTWARVDDAWWCHPKVLTLDLDARGLWISALSWSCQQQTDLIPESIVRMCGDDGTAAKKLVAAGLWDEHAAGWLVHDWDDYQSERAKKAAAGRKGGKKSGESRRGTPPDEADGSASGEADEGASDEADGGGSSEAGPSRPGPTRPNQEEARDAHPTWNQLARHCNADRWATLCASKPQLLEALAAVEDAGWPPDRAATALLSGLDCARQPAGALLTRARALATTDPDPPKAAAEGCPHCHGTGIWWSEIDNAAVQCTHPGDDRKTA